MQLLHFAHLGEAQVFIDKLKAIKHEGPFAAIYHFDKGHILVSGEGIFESLSKISYLLAQYPDITSIINFGISGALSKKLELNHIYSVRTVYAMGADVFFHSFTSATKDKSIDCISSESRVLNDQYAHKLSIFATMVDRELWGMAYGASLKNIPWLSYKLISDYAGNETQCFDLKSRALEFSQKLFDHYKKLNETQAPKQMEPDKNFAKLPGSFTQKKATQKLLSRLALKENKSEDEILTSVINQNPYLNLNQKEDVTQLINLLEIRLTPLKGIIQNKLDNYFTPFTSIGAKITFDRDFEKEAFTISMPINSETNLLKLGQVCQKTSFNDFIKIIHGDFDV